MDERTPVVTIELQLRPQPPKGSTPWFWGAGMLDFHIRRRRKVEVVWRAELPTQAIMASTSVRQVPGFGWVLVMRFDHDEAKEMLASWDLPYGLEGEVAPDGLEPGPAVWGWTGDGSGALSGVGTALGTDPAEASSKDLLSS